MQELSAQENGSPLSAHIRPIYIRLPKPKENCPHTGLKRSKMNELILPCKPNEYRPPVKSICLRKPGSIKGTRLILFESLVAYLEKFAQGGKR